MEGAKAIAAVLKDCQLSTLGCAATLALYASIPLNMHLACSQRSLRGHYLRDEGWTALFKALCENKGDKIGSWDLSGEIVGPETAKTLAEYISVSPALKSVKCACLPAQCVSSP